MANKLPAELFNEIIGYIWNDTHSLKACSLAIRAMTVPSQKRLFYRVCLRGPRKRLMGFDSESATDETSGSSKDFWGLLVKSPHIARYVQCLFIQALNDELDYNPNVDNHGEVDSSSDDDQTEVIEGYKRIKWFVPASKVAAVWLVRDKYLPLCAPLLRNLKAFILAYNEDWDHLGHRIQIALLQLMSLASLVYCRVGCGYPNTLFNILSGNNIKHLSLYGRPRFSKLLITPHCPPPGSLYLSSLEIIHPYEFLEFHSKDPNCRIDISRLQRLVVEADEISDHAVIWTILRSCRASIEDFAFTPSEKVNVLDRDSATLNYNDPIDLSKLVSLKRFTARLRVVNDDHNLRTPFRWFNKILLSKEPLLVGQRLEEISMVLLYDHDHSTVSNLQTHLTRTFAVLLENRFTALKKFNIFFAYTCDELDEIDHVADMISRSEIVAEVRSRLDVVVDVKACNGPFPFELDVRWETTPSQLQGAWDNFHISDHDYEFEDHDDEFGDVSTI